MLRSLLFLALFGFALCAHSVSPARQGAGGDGGSCPETSAGSVPGATTPAGAPEAPAVAEPVAPVRGADAGRNTTGARARPLSRWHSFLPGMLK